MSYVEPPVLVRRQSLHKLPGLEDARLRNIGRRLIINVANVLKVGD